MLGPLRAAFRKRLRKAHGGPYLSIKDEPPVRPTTPRLGADPYAKPKPAPVKKHDTPKSPHKEHDPRYRQGAGQAVDAGKIHHELAAIFKGKGEGAGLVKYPPPRGYNVNIAGDKRRIGRFFFSMQDVDGVWEGQREKSYLATEKGSVPADHVLERAAMAGRQNDEDAVFVRKDSRKSPGPGWKSGKAYAIETPHGIIDIVNPSDKNLQATIKMAELHGATSVKRRSVWTRLLLKGTDY